MRRPMLEFHRTPALLAAGLVLTLAVVWACAAAPPPQPQAQPTQAAPGVATGDAVSGPPQAPTPPPQK